MSDSVETPTVQPTPVTISPAPAAQNSAPVEMFPRSYVEELRGSEAKHRVTAREAAQRAEAAEKEVERLKGVEAQYRGLRVDSALGDAITKAGGNAKLVKLFVRDEVASLDPEAKDFASSLSAIVEKAIKDNPELKAAAQVASPAVPRAGSDITTPNTTTPVGDGQWSEAELAAARRDGRHEDIAKAHAEGKLKGIMVNRGAR